MSIAKEYANQALGSSLDGRERHFKRRLDRQERTGKWRGRIYWDRVWFKGLDIWESRDIMVRNGARITPIEM